MWMGKQTIRLEIEGVQWKTGIGQISNGFVATIAVYPKCSYFGETQEEAIKNVKDGFREIHKQLRKRQK